MMMKKSILLIALLISFSGVYAQKSKVNNAESLLKTQKLDEALDAINEAIDPNNEKSEKSIPWIKTWEVRGDIYCEIFKSDNESFKSLAENPLDIALESYKKAIELDGKGGSNTTKIKLTLMLADLSNQAIEAYNAENYGTALGAFEDILEIEALPLMQEAEAIVDTVIIFNAGLAAYNLGDYDTAIKYYNEAAQYDYNGSQMYESIADCYTGKQDTLSAINKLKEGYSKYPEGSNILVSLINLYLMSDQADEAMKYLDLAIEQEPSNATYYFVKGTLYDNIGELDNAISLYEKAVEIDSELHGAYYNMGVIYYNKGVAQVAAANDVPTDEPERYEEEKDKADVEFQKAIPYLEKAAELDPSDLYTLESLRSLYLRLGITEKYDEVNKKLEQL